MNIYITGLGSGYEVEHLVRLFYPMAPLTLTPPEDGADCVWAEKRPDKLWAMVRQGGKSQTAEAPLPIPVEEGGETPEFALASLTYDLLRSWTGVRPPWGKMTGVRPVRLVHDKRAAGWTEEEIDDFFLKRFDCSPEKYGMAKAIADLQEPILKMGSAPKTYSLYIGIPFCPSRCSYCSFVSHSIERAGNMLEEYLPLLLRELELTGRLVKEAGLTVISVYIGGGTPTTLTAEQMDRLLREIRKDFDLTACEEFTVEAGRPDTITLEKLRVMAQNGVDRISINPQTLNNSVLKAIGRRHTAEDFLDAWKLSEEFHFDRNVDLIAGLPEDTFESFRSTIEQVLALHPENITVHTLTVKHASTLKEEGPQKRTAMEMVEYSRHLLEEAGYQPYYLYRQKGTVEALENVGYTLPGKACKYNVYIMDDGHTIISAGAGGVTKLVPNGPQRITRSFNYKYPYEYINRFQTVLERKEALPLQRLNDTE